MPLSDEELRERAAHALKAHALFRHVGRRMLIDLVDKFDLQPVGPVGTPPNPTLIRPAVLVVLEGALRIDEPGSPAPTMLTPGIYAIYENPLRSVDWGGATVVYAVGHRPVRVFVLTPNQFRNHLPQILVNAMDEGEISRLLHEE